MKTKIKIVDKIRIKNLYIKKIKYFLVVSMRSAHGEKNKNRI